MHTSNVWAAWTATSNDLLAEALPRGLGLRDVEALTLIGSHEGRSVEWLRMRVGLSQSGTVRLVDRLEKLEFVRRARLGGRGVALSVTAVGLDALRQWNIGRDAALETLLAGLDGTDRERLIALLAAALTSAPRQRAEADRSCRSCQWALCEPDCPVDLSVTT